MLVVVSCVFPPGAHAALETYGVRLPPDGLVVNVPYSMGTHHEHVSAVEGTVRADPDALRVDGGRLVMPLSSFRSDNAQRACHLREALGLDYERSRYPGDHVCNDQNQLPTSGPDAIAYPRIVVELLHGAAAPAPSADARAVDVEAKLTVHGVSRPIRLGLTVSRDAPEGMIRVRGRVPVRLSDFGIRVKPAHVLFVTIAVEDTVSIEVNALLEPLRSVRPTSG